MPLNEDNQLVKYKRRKGLTWAGIVSLTGLTEQSLINIANMGDSEIGNIRLSTYELLKEKLKVDLRSK